MIPLVVWLSCKREEPEPKDPPVSDDDDDDDDVVGDDDDDTGGDDDDDDTVPTCEGVRFAQVPVAYPLPDLGYESEGPLFDAINTYEAVGCGGQQIVSIEKLDVTGDGFPDFVFPRDGCIDSQIGTSRWLVYEGGPTGISSVPTDWTLPEIPYVDTVGEPALDRTKDFDLVECDGEYLAAFTTLDLTGDGVIDLVFTLNPCESPDVGTRHWSVYPGGAGGFAPEPVEWALPDVGYLGILGEPPFEFEFATKFMECDGPGYAAYSLLDLTNDGQLDLVFTRDDCTSPDIGVRYWQVYPGGEGGFASEPLQWTLPDVGFRDSYGNPPFESLDTFDVADCGFVAASYYAYSLLDLTGDGGLDLVLTMEQCTDPLAGAAHWRVYAGGTDGFATEPLLWSLPGSGALDVFGFPQFDKVDDFTTLDCDGDANVWHSTRDLTGDDVPDLILTRDQCDYPLSGSQYWQVYAGETEGFAAEPLFWDLPSVDYERYVGGPPLPFLVTYDLMDCGTVSYDATADLTGDGVPDFVFRRDDCADSEIGRTRWEIYPGECL